MSKLIINILLSLTMLSLHGQVINPRIWMFGYTSPQTDTNSLDTGIYKKFGINTFDFRYNPYVQSRISHALGSLGCNAYIFGNMDSLILYSNGSKIFNGRHRLIEGGDRLNYGNDWNTSVYSRSYFGQYLISRYAEPIAIVNSVSDPSKYYLLSVFISSNSIINSKIVYSSIDMNVNSGNGKVMEKEIALKSGDFTESIGVCKHGNGKDWWVIAREFNKKNFTVIQLNQSGFNIISENQESKWDLSNHDAFRGNYSNRFSWKGEIFASYSYEGLELYDFDRCNGTLSNRREYKIPTDDTSSCSYVCFSPNDRLIYALLGHKIYQIEIGTNTVRKIADWDLRLDTVDGGTAAFYTSFGFPQLAPDGKIYISTSESTRYLHVIEKPNEIGQLCSFKQRSIKLLNWNSGLPNFPNYELGAVADKCGESGIADNILERIEVFPNPVSKFLVVSGQNIDGINIEIYNLLGQLMSPNIEVNHQTHHIDVRNLPAGIYLLQIRDKKGSLVRTERIVITR